MNTEVNGDEILTLHNHTERISCNAISPDGTLIATGARDGTIRLWSLETALEMLMLQVSQSEVKEIKFLDNKRLISLSSNDPLVRVWDLINGTLLGILKTQGFSADSIAISTDSSLIAIGSLEICIWDAKSLKIISVLQGHNGGVNDVAFSPDGTCIASASDDYTVRVWFLGINRSTLVLHGHREIVYSVAFSPDGSRIASGSRDETIQMWDANNGQNLAIFYEDNWVTSVRFSSDGRYILANSGLNEHIWDVNNRKSVDTCVFNVSNWSETAISLPGQSDPITWFQVSDIQMVLGSSGRIWCGYIANHLYILRLEGKIIE